MRGDQTTTAQPKPLSRPQTIQVLARYSSDDTAPAGRPSLPITVNLSFPRSETMRAILRRGVYMAAAASSRRSSPNLAGPSPTHRLSNLIQHLRQYKPPPSSEDGDADDVDERGKLFSDVGLAESATPQTVPRPDRTVPKRAAVLICLFEDDDGELRVILTQRSSALSLHSGHVALPGGKAEEGDVDDAATATREAKEEIGLDPSLVTIVNVLEPFLSKPLIRVVPVVGILSDRRAFKPVLNADEVEAIFDAPLEMFLKDENRRWEEREWLGTKYMVHYFDYTTGSKRFVIWGLTASLLIRAASVVYRRPPAFSELGREIMRFQFGKEK